MKPNILVILDKWIDGKIGFSKSPSEHNILYTLEESNLCNINVLFLEESQPIDNAIVNFVTNNHIDAIIFVYLGYSHLNPKDYVLKYLKDKNIPMCFIWPDTGFSWCVELILRISEYATLQVAVDGGQPYLNNIPNVYITYMPASEKLFYNEEKSIDISFLGTIKDNREGYLSFLQTNGINIFVATGQRNTRMTIEDYAAIVRKSAIIVNFTITGMGSQCKARVLETIQSNCLLLEGQNDKTSKFFNPGLDYIEYTTPEDLLYKCKHYLNNPDLRLAIAKTGYTTARKKYTNIQYWQKILDRIL